MFRRVIICEWASATTAQKIAALVRPVIFAFTVGLLGGGCRNVTGLPCDQAATTKPLEIRRIFDSVSGANVTSAILSDFSRNGRPIRALSMEGPGIEVLNESQVRCWTPCKLGYDAGIYRFQVMAEGYAPKQVEIAADWINKIPQKPCGYLLSGETVAEIAVQKSS